MSERVHPAEPDQRPASVAELLERRSRLEEWLERLEGTPNANPKVVERIRRDYRERLDDVLGELGRNLGALREERTRLDEALAAAESSAAEARDRLEESELRHRIGELTEEQWNERSAGLHESVADAERHRDEIRHDIRDLDQVIDRIGGDGPVDPPAGEPRAESAPPEPVHAEAEFLEDLDRAIQSLGPQTDDEPDPEAVRPKPGSKCAECGYTNDVEAWYCGVCGVDLA